MMHRHRFLRELARTTAGLGMALGVLTAPQMDSAFAFRPLPDGEGYENGSSQRRRRRRSGGHRKGHGKGKRQ